MKKIYSVLAVVFILSATLFTSCGDDKLGDSIFDTNDYGLDKNSYSYPLDYFLYVTYLQQYNIQFRYKMQDVGTDLNYNLVPSTYENSQKIAVLTKYLWFDVYDSIIAPDFLKKYGPRIIHLIGSPAYNPANGTEILGLAEGGLKVSLFNINALNTNDIDDMNEKYFKTMHHEFAHVLHQQRTYPKEFNLISFKDYRPFGWEKRSKLVAASLGFASDYGGSQTREDFVEIIANYIVKTDKDWNNLLNVASKGWEQEDPDDQYSKTTEVPDFDGVDGKAVILKKLEICRTWLADEWDVDLDALRAEVQKRQARIDMDSLLLQINKY